MDTNALCAALTSEGAPISSWMEVVSRYRRRNELDTADQVRTVIVVSIQFSDAFTSA